MYRYVFACKRVHSFDCERISVFCYQEQFIVTKDIKFIYAYGAYVCFIPALVHTFTPSTFYMHSYVHMVKACYVLLVIIQVLSVNKNFTHATIYPQKKKEKSEMEMEIKISLHLFCTIVTGEYYNIESWQTYLLLLCCFLSHLNNVYRHINCNIPYIYIYMDIYIYP